MSLKKVFRKERMRGAWVICESWLTGKQTLGDSDITMVHILPKLNQVIKN